MTMLDQYFALEILSLIEFLRLKNTTLFSLVTSLSGHVDTPQSERLWENRKLLFYQEILELIDLLV